MKKSPLWILFLAVGCASAPAASERRLRDVTVSGAPTEQLGRPSPTLVDAFAARFERHRLTGRTACCAALVAETPDLALELFRRSLRAGDDAEAAALVRALSGSGDELAATSLEAARAGRETHRAAWDKLAHAEAALAHGDEPAARSLAGEASSLMRTLGDRLGAQDAAVLGAAAGDEAAVPVVLGSAADARIAAILARRLLRKGEVARARDLERQALGYALGTRDLALAVHVETVRLEVGAELDARALGSWLRFVAGLALERRQPLLALRCGLEDQGSSDPRGLEGSLLVARAQLAAGQAPLALEKALSVAGSARATSDLALEGQADALAGEVLVALDRSGDAAGSFERAAELANAQGDIAGWVRRLVNLARSHLRRGDPAEARLVLDRLERAGALASSRFAGRVELVRALELASRDEYAAARTAIERAKQLAAALGDCETVEQAEVLGGRLAKLG